MDHLARLQVGADLRRHPQRRPDAAQRRRRRRPGIDQLAGIHRGQLSAGSGGGNLGKGRLQVAADRSDLDNANAGSPHAIDGAVEDVEIVVVDEVHVTAIRAGAPGADRGLEAGVELGLHHQGGGGALLPDLPSQQFFAHELAVVQDADAGTDALGLRQQV